MTPQPKISIVVPVFNERQNLPMLHERLTKTLDGTGKSWEILYTDDGSKDGSIDLLKQFHAARPAEVRVIEFERNAGQHMAIMAAFERARGDTVVTIDADLQNPPEEIPKLLALADQGHDVVGSVRKNRQDVGWRVWASRAMNWVRERITGIRMTDQGCMLRAYSLPIVRLIVATGEQSTFIPALGQHFAANPAEVEVDHAARHAGESKYSLYKLVRLNFDLMTGFSVVPLQLFTIVGMLVTAGSLGLVAIILGRRIFIGSEADGVFTLFAFLYFLAGVMIMGIGLLGEYVGRIYQEVRKRPRFQIRAVHEKLDT
ncbi:MAG: glycosyltransferase [Alphaproteobacteria bacterium]|nr:glycosyltransferase [Alphaproteobacteria bacterium]MBN9496587.1 glycosyltransferase [Alphaproteobacteria bacterium]